MANKASGGGGSWAGLFQNIQSISSRPEPLARQSRYQMVARVFRL
ncbi:MAG: hypothetical protein AB1611_15000 [bacterium]